MLRAPLETEHWTKSVPSLDILYDPYGIHSNRADISGILPPAVKVVWFGFIAHIPTGERVQVQLIPVTALQPLYKKSEVNIYLWVELVFSVKTNTVIINQTFFDTFGPLLNKQCLEKISDPNVANVHVFCFLSPLPLLPPATTAVFGFCLLSLYS